MNVVALNNIKLHHDQAKSLLATDITSADREAADLNEERQPLGVLKEETVAPSMEGVGRENDFELCQDDTVKQEEFVAKEEEEEEVSNIYDPAGTANVEVEASLKENKILGGEASEVVESHPKLLSAHSEILGGEQREDLEMVNPEDNCSKGSEVPIMEFVLGGEASKPGEPQPELSPTLNEIHVEMIDDDDDVPIEETGEAKMENQEFLTPEVLEVALASNDKVIEQPYESEIIKEEALVKGELIPISPTTKQESLASEEGSESDRKLLEENEMREMMQKLLEVGNEQLTAISNLSGRVKDLEKKLARKKKLRTTKVRAGSSCIKPSNNSLNGSAQKIAV